MTSLLLLVVAQRWHSRCFGADESSQSPLAGAKTRRATLGVAGQGNGFVERMSLSVYVTWKAGVGLLRDNGGKEWGPCCGCGQVQ